MNILIRELKSKRKTLLIWSIIIISFALLGYGEGSAFVGDTSIQSLMDSMPQELLKAFSMESFDMSTPEGYFGIMGPYFALALGIFSVMTGCTAIVSEVRDKTAEFSLSLPIKRYQLLFAKLIVVFIYGIVLNALSTLCSVVFGLTVNAQDGYYTFVLVSASAVFFIQLIYLAIGFFVGCVFKNHKRASSLSVSILLATYFFSMFSGMHEKLEFFKYLNPFDFFDFYKIMTSGTLEWIYVIILVALSSLLIAAGFISYQKKDIHI